MRFKPGQKVLVKGNHKNLMTSQMQRFVGKTVTIHSINRDKRFPYKIVEDTRWTWMEAFFTEPLSLNDPNVLFNLTKTYLKEGGVINE